MVENMKRGAEVSSPFNVWAFYYNLNFVDALLKSAKLRDKDIYHIKGAML